jgi:hypothetical protein
VPALNKFSDWFKREGAPLLEEFAADAKQVGAEALPVVVQGLNLTVSALKIIAPLVGDTLDAFHGLPDAAKEALLLGAAIGFIGPKLSATSTRVRQFATDTSAADVKSAALRVGIGAAGVGLVAFGAQMKDTNLAVSQASTILGDAAIGFAAQGPWGAAVGAGVGILQAFHDANKHAVPAVDSLTASLDAQSGALTANSKNMVTNALQKDGAFKKARQLGVSGGDVTDAALGNKAAIARIRQMRDEQAAQAAALAEAQSPGSGRAQAAGVKRQFDILLNSIGAQGDAVDKATQAWNDLHGAQAASRELNKLTADDVDKVAKAVKNVPKHAITKFTQPGFKDAEQNAANVARKYHLVPKDVRTILKALDYTPKQIASVIAAMKRVDGLVANPKIRVTSNAAAVARQAQQDIDGVKGSSASIRVMSRHADGGAIQGPGGPRDDRVIIAASPGEHMLDAEDVRAMGGQGEVYRFRRALHSGAPGYADGGAVGRSSSSKGGVMVDPHTLARLIGREVASALDGKHVAVSVGGQSLRGKIQGSR